MAFDRFHWIRRIGSVEREYMAARFAIDQAIEREEKTPVIGIAMARSHLGHFLGRLL